MRVPTARHASVSLSLPSRLPEVATVSSSPTLSRIVGHRHRAVIGAGHGHRQRGAVGAAIAVIHRCRRRSSVDGLAGGQRSRTAGIAVVDGIAVAAVGPDHQLGTVGQGDRGGRWSGRPACRRCRSPDTASMSAGVRRPLSLPSRLPAVATVSSSPTLTASSTATGPSLAPVMVTVSVALSVPPLPSSIGVDEGRRSTVSPAASALVPPALRLSMV